MADNSGKEILVLNDDEDHSDGVQGCFGHSVMKGERRRNNCRRGFGWPLEAALALTLTLALILTLTLTQAGTEIHSQRLIAPLPLHLSAADELIVIDHMHVFNANGFQIAVDASAPPMQRLRLESLPFSKHTVFGPSDVHELVTLLAEAPAAHIRLPKLRSMFAMRACRSAVMIGMPLDHAKMRSLVRQLASLDQPWNCPHGRPTLRHLVDLAQLASTAAAVEFEGTR